MPEIGEACPFLGYADAICCKLLITEGIACLVTVVPYMDTQKTISAMVVGLFENAVALAVDDAILE